MSCYIVFNVEALSRFSDHMSAISVSMIENDIVVDSYYSLVNPEAYFGYPNVQFIGISTENVRHTPTFPRVWEEIAPSMESGLLVTHNAVFDIGVLKKHLNTYGIAWKPKVPCLCTVQMGKRLLPGMSHRLNVLCEYYGIEPGHHKVDNDNRACAEILLHYLESGTDFHPFIRSCSPQLREI